MTINPNPESEAASGDRTPPPVTDPTALEDISTDKQPRASRPAAPSPEAPNFLIPVDYTQTSASPVELSHWEPDRRRRVVVSTPSGHRR